jgi:protein-disulfide isomerase
MAKQREGKSKREAIREQRLKRQRRQNLTIILVVGVIAIVIVGLLIYPSLKQATTPVGTIVQITPRVLPNPNGTSMGDPNAKVVVDVWEDFQCPVCDQFSQSIEPQIIANFVANGKARYVFHQYPFLDTNSVTKESHQAANASMCAAEQGRFWDYHDMLFANWNGENQGSFADKRLVAFAQALNLDMTKFNDCFKANKYQTQIEQDKTAGDQAGVSGTPSVFVNGKELTPGSVPSFDQISAAINAALAQ